jgi:hypothetical protein
VTSAVNAKLPLPTESGESGSILVISGLWRRTSDSRLIESIVLRSNSVFAKFRKPVTAAEALRATRNVRREGIFYVRTIDIKSEPKADTCVIGHLLFEIFHLSFRNTVFGLGPLVFSFMFPTPANDN